MTRILAPIAGISALALCFHECVLAYVEDHHYQSHFVFLWAFFAAALYKAGRGAVEQRLSGGIRTAGGLACGAFGLAVLYVGYATGSSTAQRLALVFTFAAWSLLAVRGWSTWRCVGYAAFALLCFGVPYSAYFQFTNVFRHSFVSLLEAVPPFLPLDYRVDGHALQFPHYRLEITGDCSGFNQLVTFLGMAFLGSLTGKSSGMRVCGLFLVGALLAYVSNFARLLVFATLVAFGQFQAVDNEAMHAAIGFAAYAPFILLFIAVILRTHRPLPAAPTPATRARGVPLLALLIPFLALRLAFSAEPEIDTSRPEYVAALAQPPGYRLLQRATSEDHEREVYATPWLVNASYRADSGEGDFELFAYLTRSRRHLAVHQVSNCLETAGTEVVYGPSVEVDGRTFWTIELRGERPQHGYFSFWIDGLDADDKMGTQIDVMRRRLTGLREVGLTRFLMPGPLQFPIPESDRQLLRWRAGHLRALENRAASPR